jgi:hypothetical protein
MKWSRTAFFTLAIFVILIGLSHGDAVAEINRWNGFNSTAFTQGFVRQHCPAQDPCQDDAFGLDGSPSHAGCPVPAGEADNTVPPCATSASAYLDVFLHLGGFAGHFPQPRGDLVGTRANLQAERVDADLFTVAGQVSTIGPDPGTVEVAVFQYSGDPNVFDGLEIDHVQELVDLGIISSDDILAVETFVGEGTVDMQVQVTGLSDDEIVLFAAGDGRIPPAVPATTAIGTALLLLTMLVLGTWALRRRNAQAD